MAVLKQKLNQKNVSLLQQGCGTVAPILISEALLFEVSVRHIHVCCV